MFRMTLCLDNLFYYYYNLNLKLNTIKTVLQNFYLTCTKNEDEHLFHTYNTPHSYISTCSQHNFLSHNGWHQKHFSVGTIK